MKVDSRYRQWRSLSNAFMTWFDAQPPMLQSEVVASKRRGRVVLRFHRFPTLRGRVWNHCLAVYASKERDAYRLFDVDCLPIAWEDEGVFVCGFCEGVKRKFSSREAMWEDHMFDPFGRWVTRVLVRAQTIEHKRIGRWRFARFVMPEAYDVSEDPAIDDGGANHLRFYRRRDPDPLRHSRR